MDECVDAWRDIGEWWQGELPKDFWRLRTACGGIFDLYSEQNGPWVLYRVCD